jgi:hypothetical protein
MKALSLHLIEGSIDQVDGTVAVTWVQSRVLTAPQLKGLKERLDAWVSKVNAVGATLEQVGGRGGRRGGAAQQAGRAAGGGGGAAAARRSGRRGSRQGLRGGAQRAHPAALRADAARAAAPLPFPCRSRSALRRCRRRLLEEPRQR